jgi:hypothetical protein
MKDVKKLPYSLARIKGANFVAEELSKRGFRTSVTAEKNSVDFYASLLSINKIFEFQVKTTQSGKRSWVLHGKDELNIKDNMFYVFVLLKVEPERPEYFIVPAKHVADTLASGYAKWIATPGKNGQKHNYSDVRKFRDPKGEYLERWDLVYKLQGL